MFVLVKKTGLPLEVADVHGANLLRDCPHEYAAIVPEAPAEELIAEKKTRKPRK